MITRNDTGSLLVWDGEPGKLIHSPDDVFYRVQCIAHGERTDVNQTPDLEVAMACARREASSKYWSRVYVEKRQAWGEQMKVGTVAMWGGLGTLEGLPA